MLLFTPVHIVAVRAVRAIERQRRDGCELPHPAGDDLCQCRRDRGADAVGSGGPDHGDRPRSTDGLSVQPRNDHRRPRGPHQTIRHGRRGNGRCLHRLNELAGCSAEHRPHRPRRLGRGQGDCGVEESPADRARGFRNRNPAGQDSGRGREQRRVNAEEQQRGKFEDERRRHDAAVLCGREPHLMDGDQNRRQNQNGEFKRTMRVRPAGRRKKELRSRNHGEKDDEPCICGNGAHSGLLLHVDGSIANREQCADQLRRSR